jgi:hypothetical protein
MPKLVVAGATIQCSFGMAPSALVVLPTNKVMAPAPAANIMDHKPMVNIPTFGMCMSLAESHRRRRHVSGYGCPHADALRSVTTAPWAPGAPKTLIREHAGAS